MADLHIAPGLALPIDMVTEPIGVLANRGRGKSYTTHVLVEEIHDAGVPVVVLDVKGDWWGVRSSADGRSEGMPFYIFGGDHADLPLEPTAGELLADLVVDERVSVVLDLSHMSKTKARSFTTAFAERLYHRNRDPLFLVVDEADVLIPQRATSETARLLGAMEDIAKRGRGRGIGMAVVTQRPQEVAKSVLDLMETLLLFGMTGPRALDRVKEWISVHVDETTTPAEVMATLPSLPVGDAWLWSPMRDILQRIHVRQMRTFDSHPTPKVGEIRRTPKTRTSLDLDALGSRIAETVERAKADDPKALHRRIRDLEQQLDAAKATPAPDPVVETVEVPVLDPAVAERLYDILDPLREQLPFLTGALLMLKQEDSPYRPGADRTDSRKAGNQGRPTTRGSAPRATSPSRNPGSVPGAGSAVHREKNPPSARETRPAADGGLSVSPARTKLLEALLALESIGVESAPRNQVALFAGVSPKSSGYANNLGAMNTAGLITYPSKGRVQITHDGRAHVEFAPEVASTEELHARVREIVSDARWRIIEPLLDTYPDPVSREDLAQMAGVSASSSGYANNLGALRSLGLLDYPDKGQVVASDLLFLESRS